MQAIIMAAGKGNRLGEFKKNAPKSFLEINGIKLIEYNIALLHAYGINEIIIVTGYQNWKFENLVQGIDGIQCVYNPFYEKTNVLGSFYMGQDYLTEDTVYIHADTLCTPGIFKDMLDSDGDMVLPVDFKLCDEEAMKVRTAMGKVVEISKNIPCDKGEGEFIGFTKISRRILTDLKQAVKKLMELQRFGAYFEEAIQELIDLHKYEIKVIETNNRFWGEIDFKEDYERADAEISNELVLLAEKEFGR
ncbi:phosphocholine cytidylyltransferase family protein [Lachnospiraceae bacterium 48-21]